MKKYVVPLLFIAAVAAAGCYPPVQPASVPSPPEPPVAIAAGAAGQSATASATNGPDEAASIPVEALRNATYSGIYDEPVTLTDGHWEGEPYVQDGASRPTVDFVEDSALFGDLDGDGVDDAVVFLVESGGGSGSFVYVAAQLNRDGQPVDAGAVLIEDRIQVKSAAIGAGQILAEAIVPGPSDGACCASHKANKVYALQDGMLAEVTLRAVTW
ncbi:MAG: hypothetical protein R2844_14215 [Caldilineales bacterium]